MDRFRHQRSPGSDRFLAAFSPGAAAADSPAFELHEDDLFATPDPDPASPPSLAPPRAAGPSPAPLLPSRRTAFRRPPQGILAALPEDDSRHPLGPKEHAAVSSHGRRAQASSSPSSATSPPASASNSPASSSSSAVRMIPAIPKPRAEYSLSVPGGTSQPQSAPVNVPMGPRRAMRGSDDLGQQEGAEDEEGDEDEMLPPHEMVARARVRESPMTTFSVLEGAGRTLKGRDLRQVRNAVWRKTGFLD